MNKNFKYMKLSPQDNVDNTEYFKAIEFGIDDKEISNIALTGPYGSGKSSILKTFKKEKKDDYNYLNISLASFNESEKKDNNISNLIQESILKQIFYQVDGDLIPFSRFKRITNKDSGSFLKDVLLFISWWISFFILFFLDLISPLIEAFIMSNLTNNNIFRFFLGGYFLFTTFYLIYKLYFLVYTKVKFIRIKALNTDIELNTSDDSSILSKNSDELLYLFEVTDYNVIIIEDLDRFENIDVFTKLRELNEMINNADNINRNINFIYALRDDLFNEFGDRLKFFDMIIPVVPIVNSTNSANKINSIIEKHDIDLDRTFINEISSYIDDMRLIKNIFNEFSIYSNSLDPDLDNKDLFSVITYKNKFPRDFSDSLKGEGLIYQTFDRKRKMIIDSIGDIQKEINKKDKKLKEIEDEPLKSVEELRVLCGNFILSKNKGNRINFTHSTNIKTEYTISQFKEGDIFNEFLNLERIYSYSRIGSRTTSQANVLTAEAIDFVDYNKRKELIELKTKKNKEKIKNEIKELKKDKVYIKTCSFSEYYNRFSSQEFFDSEEYEHNDLLKFLLINGYIKENTYENYISYLDSSNMTIKDNKFIMKVLSGQNLDFSYKLNKVDKIVERLNSDVFLKKEILNYDLLKYLIENKSIHNSCFKSIMEQLDSSTIDFIEGFINISEEDIIKDFINKLAKTWEDYWSYIIKKSNYTAEEKKDHLIWTLKYVDIEDIISLNKDDLLKKYFEEQSGIINISVENNITNEAKEVLNQLDIKFNEININLIEEESNRKKDLFEYIYENNFYKINISMISNIIKNITQEKDIEEKIKTKNYTTILENELDFLNKYLENNINQYIEDVFLKLENNKNESSEILVKLLNNKELKLENKKKIIDMSKNEILNLKVVNSIKICGYLFKTNMVESNWINLLVYYKKSNKKLDHVIVDFINQKRNYQQLKELNPINFKDVINENEVVLFVKNLFENNNISINAAQKIIESINWQYEEFAFKNMNENMLKLLIKENILLLSLTTYNELKSINNLKNIHILLLEYNEKEFLNNISEISFEKQDIIKIMNSNKLSLKAKGKFINAIDFNILFNINNLETNNLKRIMDLLNGLGFKVKMLTKYVPELDFNEITEMLKTIGEDYSALTVLRKRPTLNNANYNAGLLSALEEKEYISSYYKREDKFDVNNRYK
jgi:hypothetical protein